MSRTHKREYTRSKRFDSTCRNHGSCPHCKTDRTIQAIRVNMASVSDLKEYQEQGDTA